MLKFSGYSYLIGGPNEAEHRLIDWVDRTMIYVDPQSRFTTESPKDASFVLTRKGKRQRLIGRHDQVGSHSDPLRALTSTQDSMIEMIRTVVIVSLIPSIPRNTIGMKLIRLKMVG